MNAIEKRKTLLESFSPFGQNECCCNDKLNYSCCNSHFYFIRTQSKTGVLLFGDQNIQTIYKGIILEFTCCHSYLNINNNGQQRSFYNNEEVYQWTSTISPKCSYDYLLTTEDTICRLFYQGKEIFNGNTLTMLGTIGGVSQETEKNEYFFIREDSTHRRLFWKGKEVYNYEILDSEDFVSISLFDYFFIDGDIFYQDKKIGSGYISMETLHPDYVVGIKSSYQQISNTYSTVDVFFKGNCIRSAENVRTWNNYSLVYFHPKTYYHLILPYKGSSTTNATMEVYYQGEKVDFARSPSVGSPINARYLVISRAPTPSLLEIYYQDKILSVQASLDCSFISSDDYLLIFDNTEKSCSILWKGIVVYHAENLTNVSSSFYSTILCHECLIFFKSENERVIFISGKEFMVIDKNRNIYCCGGLLWEMDISSPPKFINIYSPDFGWMKFDIETFIRLDGLP